MTCNPKTTAEPQRQATGKVRRVSASSRAAAVAPPRSGLEFTDKLTGFSASSPMGIALQEVSHLAPAAALQLQRQTEPDIEVADEGAKLEIIGRAIAMLRRPDSVRLPIDAKSEVALAFRDGPSHPDLSGGFINVGERARGDGCSDETSDAATDTEVQRTRSGTESETTVRVPPLQKKRSETSKHTKSQAKTPRAKTNAKIVKSYCVEHALNRVIPDKTDEAYKASEQLVYATCRTTGRPSGVVDFPRQKSALVADVLPYLQALLQAAKRDQKEVYISSGGDVSSTYRSLDDQWMAWKVLGLYGHGGKAAVPGTSNHGTGRAIDFSGDMAWLSANAGLYGFVNFAGEDWHYDHLGTGRGALGRTFEAGHMRKRKGALQREIGVDEAKQLQKSYDAAVNAWKNGVAAEYQLVIKPLMAAMVNIFGPQWIAETFLGDLPEPKVAKAQAETKHRTTTKKLRSTKAVQRRPPSGGGAAASSLTSWVEFGFSGKAMRLPYADAIQRSFGSHDVSGIRAYMDRPAAEATAALGALGYASGERVALSTMASLHTVAHEAAHVIQQRSGVQLTDGVGHTGDAYEQNADAVARRVVGGRSAQDLLLPRP